MIGQSPAYVVRERITYDLCLRCAVRAGIEITDPFPQS